MSTTWRVDLDQVAWRPVGDDVMVTDVETGAIELLGGAAAVLWPVLLGGAGLDALADALVAEFGIDRSLASEDAAAFVADATGRGFLLQA